MELTMVCKPGIVTGVDVYGTNEKESLHILHHLERQIKIGALMRNITLDRAMKPAMYTGVCNYWELLDIFMPSVLQSAGEA